MAQIEDLRQWRNNAIESHLYSTAELVGDKILGMTNSPDDGYWLAQTYYGMGEYMRGAQLIQSRGFEHESMKCRYIASLCLLQAQELEKALSLLVNQAGAAVGHSGSASSTQIVAPGIHTNPGSRNPSSNFSQSPFLANINVENELNPQLGGIGNSNSNRMRVVSTSSIKNPHAQGARTISGSSRVSMILPEFDDDSAHISPLNSRDDMEELNGIFVDSLLQFLLGRVYTLQSKFGLAKDAYIAALRIDARCYDAMSQITKYHALTPKEEWALLSSLDFSRVGTDFGRSLYALRLSALTHNEDLNDAVANLVDTYQLPPSNGDILSSAGDVAYSRGQFANAKEIYEKLLADDDQNLRVYTNYVSCLYELGETNLLYKIAHELAVSSPDAAETWFAVGVYYLATKRIPEARRYFSKASLIDSGYAEAWLAFARTFADESEHEQAITAFSTVARLFPGYHLPYVHIGMQHLQLLNLSLAEKYLATAAEFFEEDPLLLNELGVVYYHKGESVRALQVLEMALIIAQKIDSDINTQVSIKANVGYALRRMNRFEEAIEAFEDVIRHTSLDSNILAAMGICYLQLNDCEKAAEKLALALAITRDDIVANDLMKRAVQATSETFDFAAFAAKNDKFIRRSRVELDFSSGA